MHLAPEKFQELDLWAHSFLEGVPLHDAFVIYLPGGGPGRTINDIHALLPVEAALRANLLVDALFRLRSSAGRLFGWDNPERYERSSYLHRMDAADRARSLVEPGTPDGPFRLLNVQPGESLRETQNATVHAFLCEALRKSEAGYHLYWGVYVKPMSRLTPLYMGLIKPFRHLLVYPAVLQRIQTAWRSKYATG